MRTLVSFGTLGPLVASLVMACGPQSTPPFDGGGDGDVEDAGRDGDADECELGLTSSEITPVDQVEGSLPTSPELSVHGLSISVRWVEETADWRGCAGGDLLVELEVDDTLSLRPAFTDPGFSCDTTDALIEATIDVCLPGAYTIEVAGVRLDATVP